jgi:hypothetical protein
MDRVAQCSLRTPDIHTRTLLVYPNVSALDQQAHRFLPIEEHRNIGNDIRLALLELCQAPDEYGSSLLEARELPRRMGAFQVQNVDV